MQTIQEIGISKTKKLSITIGYDQHYCKYFETHDSNWNLEFADWLEKDLGQDPFCY